MTVVVASMRNVTVASLIILFPVFATYADAEERVRWKMQSAFASTFGVTGEGGLKFSENLREMSGGKLQISFFEPGALVPAGEVFGAVVAGSIEAGWTTPAYHVGWLPSAAVFASLPFGPAAGEFLAWLKFGGGKELKDEIYGRYGVKGMTCSISPPQASGWFRNEIRSVADLAGLKMRSIGLGAIVWRKLGVSTQLLAPAWASLKRKKRYIYAAFQSGEIDAAEFSFPSIDYQAGLQQVAKHYYFPGWHHQSAVGEFLIDSRRYSGLSQAYRRMIEVACDANITWAYSTSEASQFAAMNRMTDNHSVKIHSWSNEMLAQFREAWEEVAKEESAKDKDFKRVYESYLDFHNRHAVWRENAYVK